MATNDYGPEINIVTWIFASIAIITVLLRLYSRLFVRHNAGWDDAVIGFSGVLTLATAILSSVAVATGTGRHTVSIAPQDLSTAIEMNLITTVFCIMNIYIPKLAVAILLRRMLNPSKWVGVTLIIMAVVGIILGFATACVTLFQCSPVAGAWDQSLDPTCWSPQVDLDVSYVAGSWAIFIDFTFALYPAVVLRKLQLNLKKKLLTILLMSLGIMAGATAIAKCSKLYLLGKRSDLLYNSGPPIYWSNIESNFVIIAACIPTLKAYTEDFKFLGFMNMSTRVASVFTSHHTQVSDSRDETLLKDQPSFDIGRGGQPGFKIGRGGQPGFEIGRGQPFDLERGPAGNIGNSIRIEQPSFDIESGLPEKPAKAIRRQVEWSVMHEDGETIHENDSI